MNTKEIRAHIIKRDFKITDHAFDEMRADGLIFQDVVSAIMNGEIIENYPKAYPLPAVLINGKTENGEPVHICVSLPPSVKIVTVYRPDSKKWTDGFCKRRL
ncbi:MAG: DUF4258 domain-containing protein [Candidatus Omnitrophota bacterium]